MEVVNERYLRGSGEIGGKEEVGAGILNKDRLEQDCRTDRDQRSD